MADKEYTNFVCYKTKYKDTEITARKWPNEHRTEILLDDNFAKLHGYNSARDFIADAFNTKAMQYKEDDKVWLEWDETKNTLKSVTISKKQS